MKKINKVVLAYSGGLDTSVLVKWLQEKYGYQVIAEDDVLPIERTDPDMVEMDPIWMTAE